MLEFFKNLGFENIRPFTGGVSFTAYYTENGFDVSLYYDKERGFIQMTINKYQLEKELLPSMDIHDPQELQQVLLKLCYLKIFLPKLYEGIVQHRTQIL